MKCFRIILPMLSVLLSLVFIQCNDGEGAESTGREIVFTDSLPGGQYAVEVKGLQVETGYLSMKVTWEPVISEELAYYEIEWEGNNLEVPAYNIDTTAYTVQTKDTTYTIENLYNENYTVRVRAVAKNMMKSVNIEKQNVQPEKDLLAPTGFVLNQVRAVGRSAEFKWTNPEDEDFYCVEVKVKEKGKEEWEIFQRSLTAETSMTILNLTPLTEYEYEIKAYDRVGNSSSGDEIQTGEMKTRNLVKVKGIKVFRFSSEEMKGEKTNGAAALIVDGDVNTYWHSIWSSGNYWVKGSKDGQGKWQVGHYANNGTSVHGRFQQYVILEFEEGIVPSRITVWPRQNAGYGAIKKFEIRAVPYGWSLDTYDPDLYGNGVTSIDLGTFDSGITGSTKEPIICDLEKEITTQYLKFTFQANTAGDSYARVAEIEIEALVDE